jgi:hypothetical protein
MAPKVAMVAAPAQVSMVPTREKRVKGSLSSKVANAVLNTRPACRETPSEWSVIHKVKTETSNSQLEGLRVPAKAAS